MTRGVFFLSTAALLLCGCSRENEPRPEWTENAACRQAIQAQIDAGLYEASQIAGCDHVRPEGAPNDYYVLRLNSQCREEICGSVLLGWYGVEKGTGRVYDWDISNNVPSAEVGKPICKYDCYGD